MALVFGITFVIVMTATLPRTDGAYGEVPLQDPLVFPVMLTGATVATVIVFPFFYFTLRSAPLRRSVKIIMGLVIAELIIVTPFRVGLGLYGSFVAFAAGLVLARLSANKRNCRANDAHL